MPVKQPSDYVPWARFGSVHHASLDQFCAEKYLSPGIHVIRCRGGNVELLAHEGTEGFQARSALPVFFGGAVTNRSSKSPPFFSGASISHSLGCSFISISDPELALGQDLGLAWYSGSQWSGTQECVQRLLLSLSLRLNRELLLIGGSGGGFASLLYAGRLQERASALVWNPQTDWLRYYKNAVNNYLSVAFPDAVELQTGENLRIETQLVELGVQHSLVTASTRLPLRLLYLQNSSDSHVQVHAFPFLKQHRFERVSRDLFVADQGSAVMLFGNWGGGHAIPPIALIEEAINLLSAPEQSPLEYVNQGQGEIARVRDITSAPVSAHFGDEFGVSVRANFVPGGVFAYAEPKGEASTDLCAFYAQDGGKRVAQQWYGEGSEAFFPASLGAMNRVTVFVRDGFGELAANASCAVEGLPTSDEPAPEIVIFGSCVSRDAFAFGIPFSDYFARSSLVSAFPALGVEAILDIDLSGLESAFQRRMVYADTRKTAGQRIGEKGYDYLLLDLIDERFSLLPSGGGFVTLSPELVRAQPSLARAEGLIDTHAGVRWKYWCDAARRLIDACGSHRVIVNRAYWANVDDTGQPLPDQDSIRRANVLLARMYGFLDAFDGLRGIDYPENVLVARSDHKWGRAPFHYVPGFYHHTLATLGALVRR